MTTGDLRSSSVLVTGGAGFVGSNLVAGLLRAGAAEVHVIDNLLSSERANVVDHPKVAFTEGSVADDRILADLPDRYDYVFHLCTFHGNQNSIHDPLADHEHNQLTTLKLYERIRDFRRLRQVVYSGAGCAVAARTADAPSATREDAPVSLEMDSPYSISKLVGELYSNYYHRTWNLPVVRARFQNVYGPREILGAGRWRGTPATVWRNVTPTFIYKSLRSEPIPLEGGGRATRDFIFVEDVVEGLLRCATIGRAGDVYNLASGAETSIAELASTINELTGCTVPPVTTPGRHWDRSGRRFGSTLKALEEIGFEARIGLREGLSRTIEWTRDHLPLIERCIARYGEFLSGPAGREL